MPARNACRDRAFQRDDYLFIDLQIVCVYFHILELKNNGIFAELQGSADGRGAVQFLTQCLCVSQRPEVLADSEAIERLRATLGALGRRKETGGCPNLWLYNTSSSLKDKKLGKYIVWLSNSITG